MATTTYVPGTQNAPFGLENTNAYGSPYAAAFSAAENYNLKLPVDPVIFAAEPQQFMDLQVLMAFATEEKLGDEVIYIEKVWGRVPLTARAGVAAPGGADLPQVVPINDLSISHVAPNTKVRYPGGATGIVQSVVTTPGAGTMTVLPLAGETLPLVTTGDLFVNGWTAGADGQAYFPSAKRMETITRTNVMEKIGPEAVHWDHLERIKWKNLEQTDYMAKQVQDVMHQLKVSICQRIWFGDYGKGTLSQGEVGKFMRGIIPSIDLAGGGALTANSANVTDIVMEGVFATDFMSRGGERLMFGTPEMLYKFGLNDKREHVRYEPNDVVSNMNLKEYDYFGHRLVAVPVQIWNDPASFPVEFRNRLVVIDPSLIKLCYMKGEPMIKQDMVTQSRSNVNPIAIYDYEKYLCRAFLTIKANNMASAFYVDVLDN